MARKKRVPRSRPELQAVPPGHRLYRISIDVLVNPAQIDTLTGEIVDVLCPDASHEGDCPNPWSMVTTDARGYDVLRRRRMLEQIRTTNPPSPY